MSETLKSILIISGMSLSGCTTSGDFLTAEESAWINSRGLLFHCSVKQGKPLCREAEFTQTYQLRMCNGLDAHKYNCKD